MRTAIAIWARRETARRWRALVALRVLAGLAGGLALAAVAGARRTETAYQRFREATRRSDAIVFATLAGIFDADYTPVPYLPRWRTRASSPLPLSRWRTPRWARCHPTTTGSTAPSTGPCYGPAGFPTPGREDEVVINLEAADQLGLEVGNRVTIASSVDFEESAPLGSGPSVEATIVGIGLSNMELMFFQSEPGFLPSAALLGNHPEIPRAGNLVVRLRPGTDIAVFAATWPTPWGCPTSPCATSPRTPSASPTARASSAPPSSSSPARWCWPAPCWSARRWPARSTGWPSRPALCGPSGLRAAAWSSG